MTVRHPGIECPCCGGPTRILETYDDHGETIRERLCRKCRHVFRTAERATEADTGRACPACGTRTAVLHTRNLVNIIERDRICTDPACRTPLTTHEAITERTCA